ncbi:hypothetical protein [Aeromicrobium sp. MLTX1]|uniref:hypothetical protein n=1 Tax=Aeromicrobium sp. MLTX1 TaxID=3389799 RepID=UPI00396B17E2
MIDEPAAHAEAAQRALLDLLQATERMDDRHEIGAVLTSLSSATQSLSESLHQIASSHDRGRQHRNHRRLRCSDVGSSEYPMSWELHRAGEILHQVSNLLQHAHEAASQDAPNKPQLTRLDHRSQSAPTGLGL